MKITRNNILTLLIGIVSGLTSFLFLAILNYLIGLLLGGNYKSINTTYILLFSLVILIFIWSRKVLTTRMIKLSQSMFWKTRSEILKILLNADYEQMNEFKAGVQSALIYDVNNLTQGSLNFIQFLTSLVVVLACLLYMAIKSLPLFFVTLGVATIGVGVYLIRVKKNNLQFVAARELEDGFMNYFNALLFGAKEIQLDRKKGDSIYKEKIIPIAKQAYENNTKAYTGFLNNQMTGQVLFYVLIASILVYFSVVLDIEVSTTVNFLFILLYLLGALETIMVLLPGLMQAKISANKISNLKKELISNTIEVEAINNKNELMTFSKIEVKNLLYLYPKKNEEEFFQIGPINWELKKGDITFVYGGNGSGKTTFIHSVLGLLKTQEGYIKWDDQFLNEHNSTDYKSLFGVVFNEFYLFDEFYGYRNFNKPKANELLKTFEMEGKLEIIENGFSVTKLSTGQRKRLALIATILEQKPIIVLDEWAADQDPYFRKKFYEEILPLLKQEGFTILAITHDDRYYNCADKIYKMEFGKLYNETHLFHNNMIENE